MLPRVLRELRIEFAYTPDGYGNYVLRSHKPQLVTYDTSRDGLLGALGAERIVSIAPYEPFRPFFDAQILRTLALQLIAEYSSFRKYDRLSLSGHPDYVGWIRKLFAQAKTEGVKVPPLANPVQGLFNDLQRLIRPSPLHVNVNGTLLETRL